MASERPIDVKPEAKRASRPPSAPSAGRRPPPSVVQRIADRAEVVRGTTVAAFREPTRIAVSAGGSALQRDARARASMVVLVLLVALTVVGELAPPLVGHEVDALRAPSLTHAFGTDAEGRDLLGAMIRGAWPTIAGGCVAALAAGTLGVAVGALAGFLRGAADAFAHRTIETAQALPSLVVVLVVEALAPNPGFGTLVAAIALARSSDVAAAVRAEVLRVMALDHVLAARALGAGPGRVFARHVLPFVLSSVSALVPFAFAAAVALETAIGALGVGRVHPLAWGALMAGVRGHAGAWWLVVFPALFTALAAGAAALLGEAMRDAVDPRLRG